MSQIRTVLSKVGSGDKHTRDVIKRMCDGNKGIAETREELFGSSVETSASCFLRLLQDKDGEVRAIYEVFLGGRISLDETVDEILLAVSDCCLRSLGEQNAA